MKLVQVGNQLINLDKVIKVDMEENDYKIIMEGNVEIELSEHEYDLFVSQYNYMNTDEVEDLIKKIGRLVTKMPEYLTKEDLIETINITTRMNSLGKELKELTKGKMLRELSLKDLVLVFKEINEEAKKMKEKLGF